MGCFGWLGLRWPVLLACFVWVGGLVVLVVAFDGCWFCVIVGFGLLLTSGLGVGWVLRTGWCFWF